MKKLCLLLLMLGCNTVEPVVPQTETHVHEHSIVSTKDPIRYVCSQLDVNENLVWVRCEFLNTSDASGEVCLKVEYRSLLTDKFVLGRKTCSGRLLAGKSSENFVAFTNTDKTRVRVNTLCGAMMDKCTMNAVEVER